jgi:hypothetical protein
VIGTLKNVSPNPKEYESAQNYGLCFFSAPTMEFDSESSWEHI